MTIIYWPFCFNWLAYLAASYALMPKPSPRHMMHQMLIEKWCSRNGLPLVGSNIAARHWAFLRVFRAARVMCAFDYLIINRSSWRPAIRLKYLFHRPPRDGAVIAASASCSIENRRMFALAANLSITSAWPRQNRATDKSARPILSRSRIAWWNDARKSSAYLCHQVQRKPCKDGTIISALLAMSRS